MGPLSRMELDGVLPGVVGKSMGSPGRRQENVSRDSGIGGVKDGLNTSGESDHDIPKFINDNNDKSSYLRGKFLGKGGFARVHELIDLKTNAVVAGKIIHKSRICKPHHKEKISREIELHRSLRHKNVVQFMKHFEDADNIYIVLENCARKSLVHVLKARHSVTEPETRYYMAQLVHGVEYIHGQNIIHRDLKLGNLFLTASMAIKIGDFGLATRLGLEKKGTICGTPNYISPEVLNKEGHGFQADVWALGCVMYALLVGQPPFETSTLKETYSRIAENHFTIPDSVSASAALLIRHLLHPVPRSRPHISTLLGDPFFSAGYFPATLPTSCCSVTPSFPATGGSNTGSQQQQQHHLLLPSRVSQHQPSSSNQQALSHLVSISHQNGASAGSQQHLHQQLGHQQSHPHHLHHHHHHHHHHVQHVKENSSSHQQHHHLHHNNYNNSGNSNYIASREISRLASSVHNLALPQDQQQHPSSTTSLYRAMSTNAIEPSSTSSSSSSSSSSASSSSSSCTSSSGSTSAPSSHLAKRQQQQLGGGGCGSLNSLYQAPQLTSSRSSSSLTTNPASIHTRTSSLHEALCSALAAMPPSVNWSSESGHLHLSPVKEGPVFITKWIDYSNKYGFGFQLSDKSVGVLFNDSSRMSYSSDRSFIQFGDNTGCTSMAAHQVPHTLQEKFTLLRYFAQYMDENLTEGGESGRRLISSQHHQRHAPHVIPQIRRWIRTPKAIIMHLTNGTIQVNYFKDHTKVIVDGDRQHVVTFINTERQVKSWQLNDLARWGAPPQVRERMTYVASVLEEFAELDEEMLVK